MAKAPLTFQMNLRITQREREALALVADTLDVTQTEIIRSLISPLAQTVSSFMEAQKIEKLRDK